MNPPLLEKWRGRVLESVHAGRYAVVAGSTLVASRGDVDAVTYMRSSAKPFQARAVLDSGAADAFGFSPEEIAVICGSHGGEEIHVRAVASILKKAGLKPSQLQCGVHAPFAASSQKALLRAGKEPTVLHNNCSGKHAGMVAAAKRMNAPLATYLDPSHPLQKANLASVAGPAGVRPSSVKVAVDGCGAPTYGLPLLAIARAFASMTAPGGGGAMSRITQAMTRHPAMVGHPCQELMTAGGGRLVGKVGAEGVYGLGVVGDGIGVAVKIDDGNMAALLPVVVAILRKHRLVGSRELAALGLLVKEEIRNHAGRVVGRQRVVLG